MSSTNYRQYVANTLALARSLTIKSEASIIGINQHVQALGHPLSDDPTTWRYYQNLAGIYHFLDIPMEVVSLDTLETIPFTKEQLQDHLVTKEQYQPGGRYYNDLVARYPEQELLIRGIVNPVAIQDAIDADDFTILHYDATLIESNETNVITALQQRVTEFGVRWHLPAYAIHDDLYVTANLAILFGQIPNWLMNIRLANCKTRYAHSFHIREYLKGHGRLDRYYDYFTKAQALWLYRNILYIERNVGKQATFDWLLQHLLTDRGIGLAEFNLHHNLEDLTDNLRPKVEFTREALNAFHRSYRAEEHTFEELLYKERNLAARNRDDEARTLAEGTRLIQHAKRGNLPTKALESAIIDWSESGVIVRTQFLMYHWAYWSSIGKYRGFVRVTHPRTNAQIELPANDAFVLFLYAYNKTLGVTLDSIPAITAQAIRRQPTPSFQTLRSIVDREVVGDELIQRAASSRFSDRDLLSPYQFVNQVTDLYQTFYDHREVYALQQHQYKRGQVQALMDHLYMDVDTRFAEHGMAYEEWFRLKGYDVLGLSTLEYKSLANALIDESTGIKLIGTHSPSAIQKALISVMGQLSSYSVQYIQEVNLGPIVFWDWPTVRVGDITGHGKTFQKVPILSTIPRSASYKGFQSVKLDLNRILKREYGLLGKLHYRHEVKTVFKAKEYRVDKVRLPLARSRMDVIEMG